MKTGNDILAAAAQHIGENYILGALAPKTQPDYQGPFDCAEFTAYINYQLTGSLAGCRNMDAYTGYYATDAEAGELVKIPVAAAACTPGAMLIRIPMPGATGHIVFSDGKGGTIEAHSTRKGVIRSVVSGRAWDYGLLVPKVVDYSAKSPVFVAPPKGFVYKWTEPLQPKSKAVEVIQSALGFVGKAVDGRYGEDTHKAVVLYQQRHGLIADGQIMAGGETAKELQIKI